MADLHIKNPATTETYLKALSECGVKLPLNTGPELGVIYDADGRDVITVDINNERADDQVERIALWIVLAVNTCGGFRAEAEEVPAL